MEPLYSTPAGGLKWFRAIVIGLLLIAGTVVVALLAAEETTAALITALSLLIAGAIIWLVLPTRYEVWPESLTIVFPLWRWSIPYETIDAVRKSNLMEAYVFGGVRFATTPHRSLTVLHRGRTLFRPHVVISPEDRDEFLRRLQLAMRSG